MVDYELVEFFLVLEFHLKWGPTTNWPILTFLNLIFMIMYYYLTWLDDTHEEQLLKN